MKTIRYFFFVALGSVLMAADCSNKDSEFYNDVYMTSTDLVQVEKQASYVVGDILWINTDNFSRYLAEPGQATPLDVYTTTGGAKSFNFTYILEKKVSDTEWGIVPLGANLIEDQGIVEETELFVQALCTFKQEDLTDPSLDRYQFRSGITLAQPGDYRLSFGYNSTSANSVELRSDSFGNNLFLNINSIFTATLDGGGYYQFTVTE